MFEGVQDQFHQFIAAANSTTPQIRAIVSSSPHPNPNIPLSFSLLHGCTSSPSPSSSTSPNSFPSVFHEHYNPHLHHQILHHQLGGGGGAVKQEGEREPRINSTHDGFLSTSLALERHRSMAVPDLIDSPWSHDEVLALLRIRSALENWFPEFTWEQVSRKLSELGFKRSPQKCKEKFEEESRSYFQTASKNDVTSMENNVSCPTKNYRLFSELEELYHHTHDPPPHHLHQQPEALINPRENDEQEEQGDLEKDEQEVELGQEERVLDKTGEGENDGSEATDEMDQEMEEDETTRTEREKSRKKHQVVSSKKKFEIFKSFCEEIVEKMMAQQEELHNKILQDMIKRDEEKIAREEAWKKQEMERINKEIEARARDFAMVSNRQAKIIEYLKKFSSNSSMNTMIITNKNDGDNEAPKSTHQNPSSSATHSSPNHLPTSSNEESISQTSNPTPTTDKKQLNFRKPRPNRPNKRPRIDNCSDGNDIGKRWPREEVLALINIRCNVDLNNKSTGADDSSQNRSSNSNNTNKNPPLWERISLKMIENGYNRSAKRCKEKWENINKYFRKTKDMNKNRSVDSRTCPYFHQLSHLYNQGRVTEGGTHDSGGDGGTAGGVGGGVSDQCEDVSGVQVTTTAACVEF